MKSRWMMMVGVAVFAAAATASMSFAQDDKEAAGAGAAPMLANMWDCVENHTNKTLHISVTTNSGTIHAYPAPGYQVRFGYNAWNKKAVLTAYEYGKDNLIYNSEFTLVNQQGQSQPSCLHITSTTTKDAELKREKSKMEGSEKVAPLR